MMDYDKIDEADIFRILAKLKKAETYPFLKTLAHRILNYIDKEWTIESVPTATEEELISIVEQFFNENSPEVTKLYQSVDQDEYDLLANLVFMYVQDCLNFDDQD